MKRIIAFLSLLLCANVNAQNVVTAGVIELPDSQVLYRGIDNKIKVTVVNLESRPVKVSGKNVQIKFIDGPNYTVRPGKGKNASIMVDCIDADSTFEIGRRYFKVFSLPDPILFWGDKRESTHLDGDALTHSLTAAYPEELPIDADFSITRWTLYYGNEQISGTGSDLSEADEFLKSAKDGNPLTIKATVLGPDGILRRVMGTWFIN